MLLYGLRMAGSAVPSLEHHLSQSLLSDCQNSLMLAGSPPSMLGTSMPDQISLDACCDDKEPLKCAHSPPLFDDQYRWRNGSRPRELRRWIEKHSREDVLRVGESLRLMFHEKNLIANRCYYLRNCRSCFVASQAVELLLSSGDADTSKQAVAIMKGLQAYGIIQHVRQTQWFADNGQFFHFQRDVNPSSSVSTAHSPTTNDTDVLLARRVAEVASKERRRLLQSVASWVSAGNIRSMDLDLTFRFGKFMRNAFFMAGLLRTHGRRLATFQSCFNWDRAVDWLITTSVALDHDQASSVLLHLSTCEVIESVQTGPGQSGTLYRFRQENQPTKQRSHSSPLKRTCSAFANLVRNESPVPQGKAATATNSFSGRELVQAMVNVYLQEVHPDSPRTDSQTRRLEAKIVGHCKYLTEVGVFRSFKGIFSFHATDDRLYQVSGIH